MMYNMYKAKSIPDQFPRNADFDRWHGRAAHAAVLNKNLVL